MSKLTFKKRLCLWNAVLASSFFISPIGYAITQINAVTAGPVNTTGTGGIEITTTGQITGNNVNGVLVNSATAADNVVTIDPANLNTVNAISITGTGNGIQVTQANGVITVNTTSGITAGADGVLIQANNTSVTNAGTITAGSSGLVNGSAIEISPLGTNATINNQAGGTLASGVGAIAPVVLVNGTGLTLVNAGTINPSAAGGAGVDAIQLNANFSTLNNQAGGVIISNAVGKSAININAAGIGGNIINNGSLSAQNQGNGVTVSQNMASGTITNNGDITVTGGLGGKGVFFNADFTTFNNAGSIAAATAGDFALVLGGANTTGTINNTGTITANNTPTVLLSGTFTALNNSGTVTSTAATGIAAVNNTTGVLVNNGTVNGGGGVAIDLGGSGPNINIPFTQNNGVITGDVILASNSGVNTFTMNGGTIVGDVDDTNAVASNIISLNAGTINGNLLLSANGDTVNLVGTSLQSLVGGAGADIINMSGGSFTSLTGGGGADILNINSSLNLSGTVNTIPTININNAGTAATVSGAITNLNTALNVNAGTVLSANANITGGPASVVTNNGTLIINPGIIVSANTFTQNANGIFSPVLAVDGTSGSIAVTSAGAGAATLNAGSFITPIAQALIPTGTVFNIVTSTNAGTIVNAANIVDPSLIVSYAQAIVPNGVNGCTAIGGCLQLTLTRTPYSYFASSPNTRAVANTLDALSQVPPASLDPDILNLFNQLQEISTQPELDEAYQSLLPPVNYAQVAGANISRDNTFSAVGARIEKMRNFKPPRLIGRSELKNGLNMGDPTCCERPTGTWLQGFVTYLDQDTRQGIQGYEARGSGGIIGTDWDVNPCFVFGVAATMSAVHTLDKAFAPKNQDITSYIGTIYGLYQPLFVPNLFVDAALSGAYHRYQMFHRLSVSDFAPVAVSDYQGGQFGVQTDIGYALLNNQFYVAPIARLKYSHLELEDYDEKEVGGLGLSLPRQIFREFGAGVGIKLAATFVYLDNFIVPEFNATALYDFTNDTEQTVAYFLGGGPGFATNGLVPDNTMYDLSAGLNVERLDFVLTAKYGVQLREQFTAKSGMLQLTYFWQTKGH